MLEQVIEELSPWVLEIKVIHLLSIICWMAGLFYLPRLFVYHVQQGLSSPMACVFQIMEEKLYGVIMRPAMILSLISGGILATVSESWSFPWMHLKIFGILGLLVFHFSLNAWRQSLKKETCSHGETFFRVINEIPTLLLILIVIAVVLKPF